MSKAESPDATTGPGTFDDRAVKALTEVMSVLDNALDHDLRDEEFLLVTPSGTYRVDAIAETCDCPDALHRGVRCKHQRRVDYARGAVPIPGWANREAIDDGLGQHLAADPLIVNMQGRTEVLSDGK